MKTFFRNLKHLFTADLAVVRQHVDELDELTSKDYAKLQVKVSVLEMKLDSLYNSAVDAAEKSIHD